jgi:hypothetical protein
MLLSFHHSPSIRVYYPIHRLPTWIRSVHFPLVYPNYDCVTLRRQGEMAHLKLRGGATMVHKQVPHNLAEVVARH